MTTRNELLSLLHDSRWKSSATCREQRRQVEKTAVRVSGVDLAATLVTNAAFVELFEAAGLENDVGGTYLWVNTINSNLPISSQDGHLRVKPGYDDHPACGVNWYGAALYSQLLGGRLPTVEEWRAARGDHPGPAADEELDAGLGNYDFGVGTTSAVDAYPANALGFHDIDTNVREWCADPYPLDDHDPDTTGGRCEALRAVVGGAWNKGPEYIRSATVRGKWPRQGSDSCGFRVALPHQDRT